MAKDVFKGLKAQAESALKELERERADVDRQIDALRNRRAELDREIAMTRAILAKVAPNDPRAKRETIQDRVLEYLQDSPQTRERLMATTELTPAQLNSALSELKAKGWAKQEAHGLWRLPTPEEWLQGRLQIAKAEPQAVIDALIPKLPDMVRREKHGGYTNLHLWFEQMQKAFPMHFAWMVPQLGYKLRKRSEEGSLAEKFDIVDTATGWVVPKPFRYKSDNR